ncbi:MAG: hypothetical protein Q9218_006698 [Villophora microphyllina]
MLIDDRACVCAIVRTVNISKLAQTMDLTRKSLWKACVRLPNAKKWVRWRSKPGDMEHDGDVPRPSGRFSTRLTSSLQQESAEAREPQLKLWLLLETESEEQQA